MSDRYYVRNRYFEACRWSGDAVLSIDLNSGWEEHRPHLTIIVGRLFATLRLPKWIVQPHRRKVQAQDWDAATIARLGRDWYWDETRREFGISLAADHVRVKYGVQPDSLPGDRTRAWYFPWMQWRSIENRWLDLRGNAFESVPDGLDYVQREAAKQRAPALRYTFNDYDGEQIEATVRLEEFEHARGSKRGWPWLDHILPRRIGRRYDIEFSKETGDRKGSWKGGMLSCNGPTLPGELHDAAFRRFAAEPRQRFTNVRPNTNGVSESSQQTVPPSDADGGEATA